MKFARTHVRSIYPKLKIFLCIPDHMMHLLDGEQDVIPYSSLNEKSDEFAIIYDLKHVVSHDPLDCLMKLEKKHIK